MARISRKEKMSIVNDVKPTGHNGDENTPEKEREMGKRD